VNEAAASGVVPLAVEAWIDSWGDTVCAEALHALRDDETRLLLVRHGATAWNAEQRYQGRLDVPLSDDGRAQVVALGDVLHGVAIDAAYTSPLARARETASAVLAGRGLRAAAVPALAELAYGEQQGLRRRDWLEQAPTQVAQWESAPWTVTFSGGESLADVHARAVPVWKQLVRAHRGESVLVSGHGHLNRVLLIHALGLRRDVFWTVPQTNASCIVVDVRSDRTTATRLASV